MASKKREDHSGAAASFDNPFARLAPLRGELPPGDEPTAEPSIVEEAGSPLGGKIVVRRERKGRGGKTVTVVEGVRLEGDALTGFAREMKRALGCGAVVESGVVVLQGAQEEAARAFLEKRGATRVVLGSRPAT